MTLRTLAIIFGIAFIAAGILGFFPFFTPNGELLGLFAVDTMHNMVHLISGIIALLAASNVRYARLYFQVFGIVYLLIGIAGVLGFMPMGMMAINMADHFLHIGIGVVAVLIGFGVKK